MAEVKSVTIAMPNMGTVKTFTMTSLLELLANTKIPVNISYPVHTYVHVARRDCVLEAQAAKTSHILFIDSDMMFHNDALDRLAERNKQVIGVHYNERTLPLVSTMKVRKGERFEGQLPKHPFQCHAVATGFLLIDTQVFDKIEKPWFDFEYNEDGSLQTGEDMFFCQQAAKAGYGIWCDPTVQVKHLGDFAY